MDSQTNSIFTNNTRRSSPELVFSPTNRNIILLGTIKKQEFSKLFDTATTRQLAVRTETLEQKVFSLKTLDYKFMEKNARNFNVDLNTTIRKAAIKKRI